MHRVLQRLRSSEAGMSLLEVLVAMMIFAVVSLGVLQTLTTVLTVSRDNRARIVAANLASQEIDLARSADDVFELSDATYTKPLNGDTFTVTRTTGWVAAGTETVACSAGGGALRYKFINVEVTWPNMRKGTEPVRFDTLLSPNERINDPALGTILVSVRGGGGNGVAGVSVSAAPASPPDGAQAPTTAIKPTDPKGCTFILKVVPGKYNITVTRANYITDDGQVTSPSKVALVSASNAVSLSFNYDEAANFALKYVASSAPARVQAPTNMTTTLVSPYSTFVSTPTTAASWTRNFKVFPWSAGYQVIAGTYVAQPTDPASTAKYCLSPNPELWAEVTVVGVTYRAPMAEKPSAGPGGNATAVVPMGLVDIAGLGDATIRAVRVNATPGSADPGCTQDFQLQFGTITSGASATTKIALPYGTWRIDKKTGTNNWSPVGSTNAISPVVGDTAVVPGTVTVDPRVAS